MKYLSTLVFIGFFSFGLSAQVKRDFVATEITKIENYLIKYKSKSALTNDQKSKLVAIFESKSKALELQYSRKMSKKDVSDAVTKIEADYMSRVETILDLDQRIALQNIPKQKTTIGTTMN